MVTNKFNVKVVDDRMLLPSSKYRFPVIADPEQQTKLDLKLFARDELKETLTDLEFNSVFNEYFHHNRILSA